jgi:citrate lyase beta subunit
LHAVDALLALVAARQDPPRDSIETAKGVAHVRRRFASAGSLERLAAMHLRGGRHALDLGVLAGNAGRLFRVRPGAQSPMPCARPTASRRWTGRTYDIADIHDGMPRRLRARADRAWAIEGKKRCAIHPTQVELANAAFLAHRGSSSRGRARVLDAMARARREQGPRRR